MDEMRQLQRILTKLLPGSIIYMPNQDGGGNKVSSGISKGGVLGWPLDGQAVGCHVLASAHCS